jgi:hypothetical protein
VVATPHALAGAFASRFARTPRSALAAGVISHLALDRVPHTDYGLANRKLLLADLAAAALVTAALTRRHRLAATGAFGGVLPDLAMVAELRTGVRVTLPLHHANHTSIEPPVVVGVLTQILTATVLLTRLHRAQRRLTARSSLGPRAERADCGWFVSELRRRRSGGDLEHAGRARRAP